MSNVLRRLQLEFEKLNTDDGSIQLTRIIYSADKIVEKFWADVDEDVDLTETEKEISESDDIDDMW